MADEVNDSGSLSVEDAVAMLDPPEGDNEQAQAAPEAADTDPKAASPAEEPAEEEPDEGADAADEDDEDAEEEEAAEPLEAPVYWSKDAKAKFAELAPELQAVVLAQEGPREEAAARAKAEAAAEREAAQREIAGVQQLAERLADFLPKAVETFKQTWGQTEPDWTAVAQQYGAEQAFIAKTQYDQQQQQLQQLQQAHTEAEHQARVAYLKAEETKLKGTPLEPVAVRQEVGHYLLKSGYTREDVEAAGAADLLLAHKAMLYDRAQSAAKGAKPALKKPVTPLVGAAKVKPGASVPSASPQVRSATKAANRFAQTKSVDDAVALLLSQG